MTVDVAKLERKLLDWINDWTEGEYAAQLTAQTDLFATGMLDSMGFTGLIAYLEDEADVEFDFERAEDAGAVSVRGLLAYCFPDAAQAEGSGAGGFDVRD